MTTLYELPPAYTDLIDIADDPEAPAIADLMALIEAETEEKVLRLARVVRSLEAEAAAIDAEVDRLMARSAARKNRVQSIKDYMKNMLILAGLERVKDAVITVWTQPNPPSVEVLDEAAVPVEYQRATWMGVPSRLPPELREEARIEVNKRAILDAVKEDGEAIPGIDIKHGERHLRLR